MLLFLSADAIMALTFFVVFAYLRFHSPQLADCIPFSFRFNGSRYDNVSAGWKLHDLLGGACDARRRGRTHVSSRWIAVTVASWSSFLLLEGMEWVRLILL